MRAKVSSLLFLPLFAVPAALAGGLPITGRNVTELDWADTEMINFMDENGITGGLLAIMHNGCIVYQRGFGWHNSAEDEPMPENALVRVASCSKPFTAAAIQRLATGGTFGVNGIDRLAFNLSGNGGFLNAAPSPSLGDSRLANITIRHLLTHQGGWDRTVTLDLTRRECEVADDMNVAAPASPHNTMRWILGQPLDFAPGMRSEYSNVGFLAMGLMVEQASGTDLFTYLRSNILTPDMWVPSTDLRQGRSFRANQPVREAYYPAGIDNCVFEDANCPLGCFTQVEESYGGIAIESRPGQGGVVASAATMLQFAERYDVESVSSVTGAPLNGTRVNSSHNGGQPGVNCRIWQRSDGTNVFMWFNADSPAGVDNYGDQFATRIDAELDAQTSWPSLCLDGFWVDPADSPFPEFFGSYNEPFHTMGNAMSIVTNGSKLNLRPGNSPWTGTINKKVLIRAPLGTARLGT